MTENLHFSKPAPLESRISPAESFGLSSKELKSFQGTVVSSFEEMVSSNEYDYLFEKFRSAYEFRKKYNWNVESGKVVDRPNGITQAVDNMMLHANMNFFGLAEERRRMPLDDIFRYQLINGMREAAQLNRGVIALASQFTDKSDLTSVEPQLVTDSLSAAMNTYWDRTGFPEPERFK